jgi:rRNA maturation protein Rpf1
MLTTSRYASEETRRAARSLASSSGSRFVARGKKTIAELAELARKGGDATIGIVEERGGKPAFISSMEVLARGGWRWAGRKGVDESKGKD